MPLDELIASVHARVKRSSWAAKVLRPVARTVLGSWPVVGSIVRGNKPIRTAGRGSVPIRSIALTSREVVAGCVIEHELPTCLDTVPADYTSRQSTHPALCLHELSDALVVGQVAVFHSDGSLVVGPSRTGCGPVDRDGRTTESVDLPRWSPAPTHLEGTSALCSDVLAMGYWHWMMEVNAKIGLLKGAGIELDTIDHFIVNSTLTSFQQVTLERWGIPKHKIVSSQRTPVIKAERLLVPDHIGDIREPHPFAFQVLRDLYGGAVEPGARRLYISRQETSHRRITNHQELVDLLTPFGFEIILPENLSMEAKAAAFAEAEIVVGATGAGFTHLAHCAPGTKIVEFVRDGVDDTWYWHTSAALGLQYAIVRVPNHDGHDSSANMTVPIEAVAETLSALHIR